MPLRLLAAAAAAAMAMAVASNRLLVMATATATTATPSFNRGVSGRRGRAQNAETITHSALLARTGPARY